MYKLSVEKTTRLNCKAGHISCTRGLPKSILEEFRNPDPGRDPGGSNPESAGLVVCSGIGNPIPNQVHMLYRLQGKLVCYCSWFTLEIFFYLEHKIVTRHVGVVIWS